MDDPEWRKEILALYGTAIYCSIAFEQELIIMFLAVARLVSPAVSAAEVAHVDEELFGRAVDLRNDLVHRFWYRAADEYVGGDSGAQLQGPV